MTFSNTLKTLMESNGMTNYRLAKVLGCSQSSIANWLDGKTKPSPDRLQAIADCFHVSVSELLGETKKAPVVSDKGDRSAMEQEFIELYRRLTPDQKKTVSALIHALLDDKE